MSTTLTSTFASDQRVSVVWSNVALVALAIVTLIVHSYNMFGFPLYLGDEGIYMSQAYAIVKMGQLTPYAYWYDHAPAGWILLAAWSVITGGFHTFEIAIDGGRALMLLLHVISNVLLFRVVLRLTNNPFAAIAAGLLYALSPLVIIYGRMVLLDNIMVFWALLATMLMLQNDGRLWPVFYSGVCLGLAVLTKESAILLFPAFFYAVWTQIAKHHLRFARAAWIFGALATISLYFLYATLRKELLDFSFSSPLSGDSESVTLLGAMFWQMSRTGGAPWDPSSDFYQALTTTWIIRDPWLLGIGVVATLWNLIRGNHQRRFVALLSVCAILGVARGTEVLDFYIIPLLPFMALNAGLALADLVTLARAPALMPAFVVAAIAIGWFNLDGQREIFTLNLTTTQRQALAWVQDHVPADAQIIVDDDLWVNMRDGGPGKPDFLGTHSHWKVANDPAVYEDLFKEDWRNIDYLIMTPGLEQIFEQDEGKLTYEAYSRSTPIESFSVGDAAIEIRKVNHSGIAVNEIVRSSYASFRDRFIEDGQVRPVEGYTTAQDQATAMLMAVWMDDRETFDDVWTWTRLNLQNDTRLLYHTNEPGVQPRSATDADTDAALALLLAERRWNDASYGRAGVEIVQKIWEQSVVEINGAFYLAAGDWAVSDEQVIFAPATFAPYAYHFFAEVDPEHDWQNVLDTNYQLLADVTNDQLGERRSAGLPPAYVGINRADGSLMPNPPAAPTRGNTFDEMAAQVYWRVALDEQWHEEGRATSFLTASRFLHNEWEDKGEMASSYAHTGTPETKTESLVLYSAVLPKFLVEEPQIAHELYATKLAAAFTRTASGNQWGSGTDIAEQRWAWLATGFYNGTLTYEWDNQ
ncbi:MAG: glycosyl hydrolase family 8 [Chloroflexaceae bacterium]